MINTLLVLVSISVYTFDVSNTTVEDKDVVSMHIRGHGKLSSGEMLALLLAGPAYVCVTTQPKHQPYV